MIGNLEKKILYQFGTQVCIWQLIPLSSIRKTPAEAVYESQGYEGWVIFALTIFQFKVIVTMLCG